MFIIKFLTSPPGLIKAHLDFMALRTFIVPYTKALDTAMAERSTDILLPQEAPTCWGSLSETYIIEFKFYTLYG